MSQFNFSSAATVGLYQSVFGCIIVLTVNAIIKRIESDYALF
jgi:putative aldouronate transport system permease protein